MKNQGIKDVLHSEKRKNKQKGVRDEEVGSGTMKSKEKQNHEAEKSADGKSRNSRAKRHGLE